MNNSIENKVVVVTGGASGIGFSIVDKLLEGNAKLVIILDINEELGNKVIKDIEERFGNKKAVFFKCDVNSDLEDCFKNITAEYKNIELLVNNAGVANEIFFRHTVNINLASVMEWSVKFYDYMRKDANGNGGTIINVASLYGLQVTPFVPSYHASKFGVIGFSQSLGHEYNFKRTGVRVVTVCPGYTYTTMTKVTNINLRDKNVLDDYIKHAESHEWQEVDAVGEGVKQVFEKADSGTVWAVEGTRPPVMIKS